MSVSAMLSRSLNRTRIDLPARVSIRPLLRRACQVIFWSPLLLLTGLVHILCQPRTKKFLLGLVILDIPLQWGTHFDFNPSAASMGALGGFDFSITTISLLALYIGWLFSSRAEGIRPHTVWNWPIASYTAVLIASLFVTTSVQLSLFQIGFMIQMLLLYLYLAGNLTLRDDIDFILYLLLIGGLLESAYILTLAYTGHEFAVIRAIGFKTSLFLPWGSAQSVRPGGTIGSPNDASAYLAIIIVLALSVRRMSVPSYLRRLAIPTIILAGGALIATLSRGGWIELLVSIAILAGATCLRNGISAKAAFAAVMVATVVAICLYLPNPISRRIFADDHGAAHSRVPLMHLAYRMISANPILGVGANNFVVVMNDYAGSEFRHEWIYQVHNEFLLVCSETGVIGLAAYLWIYFNLTRRGWRIWKARDEMLAPLALGIVAAIGGFLAHMLVEGFPYGGLVQLVWLFAALIGICELIQRRELVDQDFSAGPRSQPATRGRTS